MSTPDLTYHNSTSSLWDDARPIRQLTGSLRVGLAAGAVANVGFVVHTYA